MQPVIAINKKIHVNSITFQDQSVLTSARSFNEDVQFRKRIRVNGDGTFDKNLTVNGKIYGELATIDPLSEQYTNLRTGWPWPVQNEDTITYDPAIDSLWSHINIIEQSPYASQSYVQDSLKNTLAFLRILPIADGGTGYNYYNDPSSQYLLPVTTLSSQNIFLIRNDEITQQTFKFQDDQTGEGKFLMALDGDGTVGWGVPSSTLAPGSQTIVSSYGQSELSSLTVSDDGAGSQPVQTLEHFMNMPGTASSTHNQFIVNQTIALLSGRFANGFSAGSQPPFLVGPYSIGSEGVRFQSGYLNNSSVYVSGSTKIGGGKRSHLNQSILLEESGIHISSDTSGTHLWGKVFLHSRINESSSNYSQPPDVHFPNGPSGTIPASFQVGEDLSNKNGTLSIFGGLQLKPYTGITSSTLPSFLQVINAEGNTQWANLPILYSLPGQQTFNIIRASGNDKFPVFSVTKSASDGTSKKSFTILPKPSSGMYNHIVQKDDILVVGTDTTQYDADPSTIGYFPETKSRLCFTVWSNYCEGIAIRPSLQTEENALNPNLSGYLRMTAAAKYFTSVSDEERIPSHYMEINRQGLLIMNGQTPNTQSQDTSTRIFGKLKILNLSSTQTVLNNTNSNHQTITGGFYVGDSTTSSAVSSNFYGSLKYKYPGATFDSTKQYILQVNSSDGAIVWAESAVPVSSGDEINIVKQVNFNEDIYLYNNMWFWSIDLGLVPAAIVGAVVYAWASGDTSGAMRTDMLDSRSQYYWRFLVNGVSKYPLKLTYETAYVPDITIANTSRPIYDSQISTENNNIKMTNPIQPASLSIFGDIFFRQPLDDNSAYNYPLLGSIPMCTKIVNRTYSGTVIAMGCAQWVNLESVLPTTVSSNITYVGDFVKFGTEIGYTYTKYGQATYQDIQPIGVSFFGKMYYRNVVSAIPPWESIAISPLGYVLGCVDENTGEIGWIPPGGSSDPTFNSLTVTNSSHLMGDMISEGDNTFYGINQFNEPVRLNYGSPTADKVLSCIGSTGETRWVFPNEVPGNIPANLSVETVTTTELTVTNQLQTTKEENAISSSLTLNALNGIAVWYNDSARTVQLNGLDVQRPRPRVSEGSGSIPTRSAPYYLRCTTNNTNYSITSPARTNHAIKVKQNMAINHRWCYYKDWDGASSHQEVYMWYRIEWCTVYIYENGALWSTIHVPLRDGSVDAGTVTDSLNTIFVRHDRENNTDHSKVTTPIIMNNYMQFALIEFDFYPASDDLPHTYSMQYVIDFQFQYQYQEINHFNNEEGAYNAMTLIMNPSPILNQGWSPYYTPAYTSNQASWQSLFIAIYFNNTTKISNLTEYRPVPYTQGNNFTEIYPSIQQTFSETDLRVAIPTSWNSNGSTKMGKLIVSDLNVSSSIFVPNGIIGACGLLGRQGYPKNNGNLQDIRGKTNFIGSYDSWEGNFNFWWNGKVEIWVDYTKVLSMTPNYSDYRLKRNLAILPPILDRLVEVDIYFYDIQETGSIPYSVNHIGVLAHELQEKFPEMTNLVEGEKDAVQSTGEPVHQFVNQNEVTYLLMKAIQELKIQVDELKTQVCLLQMAQGL